MNTYQKWSENIKVQFDNRPSLNLDKKDLRNFNTFIEYTGPIKAPIEKDKEIAFIKIYNKDELLKSIPVFSSEKVKKINFLLSLLTSFNYMIWGDA